MNKTVQESNDTLKASVNARVTTLKNFFTEAINNAVTSATTSVEERERSACLKTHRQVDERAAGTRLSRSLILPTHGATPPTQLETFFKVSMISNEQTLKLRPGSAT